LNDAASGEWACSRVRSVRVTAPETAIDAIRDRFGEDAVQRARLLGRAPVVRDRIAFGSTATPTTTEGYASAVPRVVGWS
jgi:hypothetical protein